MNNTQPPHPLHCPTNQLHNDVGDTLPPPSSETMAVWYDNLDLSSIPLNDHSNNLSLFDTYNLEDIQWYPPASASIHPHTSSSYPQPAPQNP